MQGTMDFQGNGTIIAKLSNGETRKVSCLIVARGISYSSHYEKIGEYDMLVSEDGMNDCDLSDLEIPYPNEFTYVETGEMDEDASVEIVSIESIIELDMTEIDGSFENSKDCM